MSDITNKQRTGDKQINLKVHWIERNCSLLAVRYYSVLSWHLYWKMMKMKINRIRSFLNCPALAVTAIQLSAFSSTYNQTSTWH